MRLSFINDHELLYKLDAHVQRACKRFKAPYDETKIKKFSRTYYELSKMETTNYIPSDEREIKKLIRLLTTVKKDSNSQKKEKEQAARIEKQKLEYADIAADIEEDIEFY